jgi:hypothetical protein
MKTTENGAYENVQVTATDAASKEENISWSREDETHLFFWMDQKKKKMRVTDDTRRSEDQDETYNIIRRLASS